MPNPTLVRRQNALALFQAYAERALAAGAAPKGLEQAFAATLQVSPSMWSQIKSARPIGDKLARQIERHHARPVGWLDETRGEAAALQPAEKAFLALALAAWRATNRAGRQQLRTQLQCGAVLGEGGGGAALSQTALPAPAAALVRRRVRAQPQGER